MKLPGDVDFLFLLFAGVQPTASHYADAVSSLQQHPYQGGDASTLEQSIFGGVVIMLARSVVMVKIDGKVTVLGTAWIGP